MTVSAASHHEVGGSLAPSSEGELRVLLVGRPNTGKSSLYNLLTGGHARVGNFPGVTVDVLEASVDVDGNPVRLVDLPGVYSVEVAADPASDEGHARAFLEEAERAAGGLLVAQVVDATQLALGLRLLAELRRRAAPLALVVTQIDVLEKQGQLLDAEALASAVGLPVIAVSALDPSARPRLLRFLVDTARNPAGDRHGEIDAEALAKTVVRERRDVVPAMRARRDRTARIDAVLLHPLMGPVVFLGIMTALFASVFLVAEPVSSLIDAANRMLAGRVEAALGTGWLSSLINDGVLGGAGTVLAFLPQIVILTLAMEVIDASGYLSRGAFLVDRILRAAGLGGRSFVPLLTAHACAVPAVQATRAIRDPAQRLRTILVLPLMTCSARIPTYGLLIAAFFGGRSALVKGGMFVGLYFAGVLAGLVASLVIGRTVRSTGRSLPLVLEMPGYRMPRARVIVRAAGRTTARFLKDVGSMILIASVALWLLLAVPGPKTDGPPSIPPGSPPRVVRMHGSVAAYLGRKLEPITRAAGFDWRINVGLMGSFGARELMVSTMGVIFGIEDEVKDADSRLVDRIRAARGPDGKPAYGMATALALMAFFVIACQCTSTLAAIRRETRSWKWPAFVFAYTYAAAFALAVIVYRGASLLGG